MTERLTVVIPAYNEEESIGAVLQGLRSSCEDIVAEVIVVDDGSVDNTAQVVESTGLARLIRHTSNRGYGAALKTGIRAAETPYVLTMDSDGQHTGTDVRRIWEALNGEDMIVGERQALIHSPMWRMPGKWLLGLMANYLTQHRIPDLNSGLRIMRREIVTNYLHICPSGFSFSTTITMAFLSQGHTVRYIPINVQKRVGKSTVSLATGFNTIILILRLATLFNPLRVFLPTSFLIAAIGVAWGIPFALAGRGVSVGAMLAIVTAVVLFALGLISDQISQMRLERFS